MAEIPRSKTSAPVGARIAPFSGSYQGAKLPAIAATAPRLAFGATPDNTLEQLGAGLANAGVAVKSAEDQKMQRLRRAEEGAWISRTLNEARQDFLGKMENAKTKSGPGATDFAKNFMQQYDEWRPSVEDKAPSEEARYALSARLDSLGTSLYENALHYEAGERAAKTLEDLRSSYNTGANVVINDPSQYAEVRADVLAGIDTAGTMLTPDGQREAKVNAEATLAESYYRGKIKQNPWSALKELRSGQFKDRVTANQMEVLQNTAEAEINRRETKARVERNALETLLKKQVKDATDQLGRGHMPTNLKALEKVTSGFPELSKDLADAETHQLAVSQFNLLPLTQQEQVLIQMNAELKKNSDASSSKLYELYEKNHRANVSLREADPYQAAADAGMVTPTELDWTNPSSIAQRSAQAGVVDQFNGKVASPFFDTEVDQFKNIYDQATIDQKQVLLTNLGSLDDQTLQKFAEQVDKKDSSLAATIAISREDPRLTRAIIQGAQIKKEFKDVQPTGQEVSLAMEEIFGAEFIQAHPKAAAAYRELAINLYFQRTGQFDGTYDQDVLENSLRAVAGGQLTADGVRGGPIEHNGAIIVPPVRGMTEREFNDDMRAITKEDLRKYGNGIPTYGDSLDEVTPDEFRDMTLVQVGDGRYLVTAENGLILGYGNKPFVIDLGKYARDRGRK